jgi:hypothetical protein
MCVSISKKALINCRAPVTHTCNSSYSGGRDQEAHSLKPAQANGSVRTYLDKTLYKKKKKKEKKERLVEWLKE